MRVLAEKDTATEARQAAVSAAAAAQQETYSAVSARDAAVADCAEALAERDTALANSALALTQLQAAVAERHAALEECKVANSQKEAAFQTAQQAQHAQQAAEAAAAAADIQLQETAQVLLETQTAQKAAEESLKVFQQQIKQFSSAQEEATSEVRQLQGALSAAQTLLGQLEADKAWLAAEITAKTELAAVEAHQTQQTEADLAQTQTELQKSATQTFRLSESLRDAKADAAAQLQRLQSKLQTAEASLVTVQTEQAQQVTANEKARLQYDQLLAELNALEKEHAKTMKNTQDLTSAIKRFAVATHCPPPPPLLYPCLTPSPPLNSSFLLATLATACSPVHKLHNLGLQRCVHFLAPSYCRHCINHNDSCVLQLITGPII